MERNPRNSSVSPGRWRHALARRSPRSLSVLSLLIGGALFWCLVLWTGGFATGDADATIYNAMMWSHGFWACAYRSIPTTRPLGGPVYPLVSAGVQWITRAGFSGSYLTPGQMGIHCQHAYASYQSFAGSTRTSAFTWALRTGIIAWVALTLGALSLVRTTSLRGTRATWLVPLAFAVTPPVLFCVQEFYHPQDLWALAMVFVAVTWGLRGHQVTSGVFWALAVMSQPYALLGLVAVLVIASWPDRRRLVVGGVVCAASVGAITWAVAGRRALAAALVGTGDTTIHYGTWMSQLHVSAHAGLAISRGGPLVATALLSWWVRKRCPGAGRDPAVLLGLLAAAWSLRLVFEENLWGYYCMATGATLVLHDIVTRKSSRPTIYWLVIVMIAFGDINATPRPWGLWPTWIWQLLIAPSAFVVALHALRSSMRTGASVTDVLTPRT